ncbi:hypothetical protein HK100_008904 [Physocladia obscura]|uniref:Uncharacterized protein n=1 Tax=Physocladia obscura TaxID=109957 RepID=A0AAD5XHU6_9FUNG|nr:hypothetical protein HK100_008904 [Physocladia obscura]
MFGRPLIQRGRTLALYHPPHTAPTSGTGATGAGSTTGTSSLASSSSSSHTLGDLLEREQEQEHEYEHEQEIAFERQGLGLGVTGSVALGLGLVAGHVARNHNHRDYAQYHASHRCDCACDHDAATAMPAPVPTAAAASPAAPAPTSTPTAFISAISSISTPTSPSQQPLQIRENQSRGHRPVSSFPVRPAYPVYPVPPLHPLHPHRHSHNPLFRHSLAAKNSLNSLAAYSLLATDSLTITAPASATNTSPATDNSPAATSLAAHSVSVATSSQIVHNSLDSAILNFTKISKNFANLSVHLLNFADTVFDHNPSNTASNNNNDTESSQAFTARRNSTSILKNPSRASQPKSLKTLETLLIFMIQNNIPTKASNSGSISTSNKNHENLNSNRLSLKTPKSRIENTYNRLLENAARHGSLLAKYNLAVRCVHQGLLEKAFGLFAEIVSCYSSFCPDLESLEAVKYNENAAAPSAFSQAPQVYHDALWNLQILLREGIGSSSS